MRFVSFYVQTLGGHPHLRVAHAEYLQLLEYMVKSVRHFHPQAGVTLITDVHTDLSTLRVDVTRENHPIDRQCLMLSRAESQLRHLQAHGFDQSVLFLDSDMLVNGELPNLLDEDDFDVALTVREHAQMPVNSGFLLVNHRRPQQVQQFYDCYLQIFRDRHLGEASWFGDQRSLSDTLTAFQQRADVASPKLRLLSCDRYNHTPGNRVRKVLKPRPERTILHFKGKQKRLMPLYWYAHLSGWPRPLGIMAWGFLMASRWLRRAAVLNGSVAALHSS